MSSLQCKKRVHLEVHHRALVQYSKSTEAAFETGHQVGDIATRLLGDKVSIVEMLIDDSWARDSGPNFLINDRGELAGSTWQFNAWGNKYDPYDQDAEMGSRILRHAGVTEFTSQMIAEGGAITVDGEGTVITTETCLLNANRNPPKHLNDLCLYQRN